MKVIRILLSCAFTLISCISLSAQEYKVISKGDYRYEGEWPAGHGTLYSYKEGLVIGTFQKAKPHGLCICYRPNGEVYWGEFKKGKATGNGRLYRNNGIVISGGYKNGRYHGVDTLFRSNGTIHIGEYNNGRLIARLSDTRELVGLVKAEKPEYPQVYLRERHEAFLRELELIEEEKNFMITRKHGLIYPSFQGGSVDDFALWVNSQIGYPIQFRSERDTRTVIVEFVVRKDGTVSDVHAIFGSDPVLNEEAVKVVSSSPEWTPGEQNGEKKNVRLSVPVVFSM